MPKNIKGCLMHETDNWQTPKFIYKHFMQKNFIDLFPYKASYNQYEIDYKKQYLFCNPPFSQMDKVADYLIKQINNDCLIALMIPTRTDTKYFNKLKPYCYHIEFIKGRLHYNETKKVAPFPTMIMYLSKYVLIPTWTTREQSYYENTNN